MRLSCSKNFGYSNCVYVIEATRKEEYEFWREPGEYKLEVFKIKKTMKGDIYMVQTGKKYYFDRLRNLYDAETNQKLEKSSKNTLILRFG
jgi:hypothetical protein